MNHFLYNTKDPDHPRCHHSRFTWCKHCGVTFTKGPPVTEEQRARAKEAIDKVIAEWERDGMFDHIGSPEHQRKVQRHSRMYPRKVTSSHRFRKMVQNYGKTEKVPIPKTPSQYDIDREYKRLYGQEDSDNVG